jgi:recombination associated protein RdgC
LLKNLILYRLSKSSGAGLPSIELFDDIMSSKAFVPTGSTQEKSVGWVAPNLVDGDPLSYHSAGQTVLRLRIETRAVPGSVIDRKVGEMVGLIEEKEGRKPGRKERREIREEAHFSLLPMAFTKQADVVIWIDRNTGLLAVGAGSQGRADEAITALVQTFDQLHINQVNTNTVPAAAMTAWLAVPSDQWPEHFAPGRHVELQSGDEAKSVVKFDRHHLDDEQMRLHIGQGKLPTKLALGWMGRVDFVLTEGLAIKRIELLDTAMADAGDASGFEADVAIFTGEMSALLSDLIRALGGEMS